MPYIKDRMSSTRIKAELAGNGNVLIELTRDQAEAYIAVIGNVSAADLQRIMDQWPNPPQVPWYHPVCRMYDAITDALGVDPSK